jgi:hypothetical protein
VKQAALQYASSTSKKRKFDEWNQPKQNKYTLFLVPQQKKILKKTKKNLN